MLQHTAVTRRAGRSGAVGGLMLLLVLACGHATSHMPATSLSAPHAASAYSARWLRLPLPGGGALVAAVERPASAGPFPAVLLLHGSHGFAGEYVQLARALARHDFVVVAACWFRGGAGAGTWFVTPIPCPDAPEMTAGTSPAAQRTVAALVEAVRALPGVRADRLALFGHSRGGVAALEYTLATSGVQALVLNSAAYPPELVSRAGALSVPLLMLHGTQDAPDDGGSPMTGINRARAFETVLRVAGKRVETMYVDGGRHNSLFTSQEQQAAAVSRMRDFLERHLTR